MSDASSVRLAISREVSFAATHPVNPVLQAMRFNNESIEKATASVQSEEIVTGRQVSDEIRTDINATGQINRHFAFGGFTTRKQLGAIAAVASTQRFTAPNNSFQLINQGDWIRYYRAGSSNNGYWFVNAKGSSHEYLQVSGPSPRPGKAERTLVDESAGSEAEIAVDDEFDLQLAAAVQSLGWTNDIFMGATGSIFSVDGAGKVSRSAVSLNQTGVFSIDGAGKLARNDTGSGGSFITDGIKIGMKLLIAGFAGALNNGLHTVLTVTAGVVGFGADGNAEALTTESSPGTAVTVKSDFVSDGYAVGMWVRLSGFATSTNNGLHRLTAVTATKLTCAVALTTEAPAGQVRIHAGSFVKNGSECPSFLIEKDYSDRSTDEFDRMTGMCVNTFNLSFQAKAASSCGFGYMGKNVLPSGATAGTGSNRPAGTTTIMDALANVTDIKMDDALLGTFAQQVSLALSNNLFDESAIANLGPIRIGSGQFSGSGEFNLYFENHDIVDLNDNWTKVKLAFTFTDAATSIYHFYFPSVLIKRVSKPTQGNNQSLYQRAQFQALRDATLLETARITRWQF